MKLRPANNRKGSAVIVAIGMGIVLLIIIMGLQSFSSHRIHTTIMETRRAKALALAEAGLEFALTEMSQNFDFSTHELSPDLEWQTANSRNKSIKDNSAFNLSISNSGRGTYSGTFGDGEFKVRVGYIPFSDDLDTVNIDESKSYVLIESLGNYMGTVRKVESVVNRRFPAREFLMYDGGVLSLIYGQPTDSSGVNVFSTGHLYGHSAIEIGRVLNTRQVPSGTGTNQQLDNMNAIISGAGGIFIYSPIQSQFRDKRETPGKTAIIPTNTTFPTNGNYSSADARRHGEFPEELRGKTPDIPGDLKPWVFDRRDGVSLPPKPISFDRYRDEARRKGLYFASGDTNYRMPNGWTESGANFVRSRILDFGTNIRAGNLTLPADFNGVIFCEDDLVIKGNPPKDINIVSRKNVFVAGDFNQSGDPGVLDEFYGLPQDYPPGTNALTSPDYDESIRQKLLDDADSTAAHRNHVAASVIARERIVYDYRSPVDCFENEIYPFMKYKLAEYISDETTAKTNVIERNNSGIIAAAGDEDEFKANLDRYFADYPLTDTRETALKNDLVNEYNANSGQFDFGTFDQMTRKMWQSYSEGYSPTKDGRVSTEAESEDYGVYQLLFGLRKKLGVPGGGRSPVSNPNALTYQPGDFLFYPEITANGMFISGGKLNNVFYAGPDFSKSYNKIGSTNSPGVGIAHSHMSHMVHRVFGSEMNLRMYDVHRLGSGFYEPPIRRKVYDESLPLMGFDAFEMANYIVLSWRDSAGSLTYYSAF